MLDSQTDKGLEDFDFVYNRSEVRLLKEKQWLYLKGHHHMTPREVQMAKLVCQGFSNKQIAEALNITHGTVKTHIRNIYRKIRVHSKIAMLLKFVQEAEKQSTDHATI